MRRLAAILALLLMPGLPAAGQTWTVDAAASRVEFAVRQMGVPVTGRFEAFTATIRFDPATAEGEVEVRFALDRVSGSRREVASELPKPEWFDAASHPQGIFRANRFRREADGYVAEGSLTLKGITRPLALPFTLAGEGASRTMRGQATIRRSDFAVGSGPWARLDVVADEVTVTVLLLAQRAE
ncbi:MAG: YceI family protein [Thalassobaculales bacterium]